jgi:hypothetical protein
MEEASARSPVNQIRKAAVEARAESLAAYRAWSQARAAAEQLGLEHYEAVFLAERLAIEHVKAEYDAERLTQEHAELVKEHAHARKEKQMKPVRARRRTMKHRVSGLVRGSRSLVRRQTVPLLTPGIYGAVVQRAPDWEFHHQDGGPGLWPSRRRLTGVVLPLTEDIIMEWVDDALDSIYWGQDGTGGWGPARSCQVRWTFNTETANYKCGDMQAYDIHLAPRWRSWRLRRSCTSVETLRWWVAYYELLLRFRSRLKHHGMWDLRSGAVECLILYEWSHFTQAARDIHRMVIREGPLMVDPDVEDTPSATCTDVDAAAAIEDLARLTGGTPTCAFGDGEGEAARELGNSQASSTDSNCP